MQKTVILGSGESGFGAALLAHKHGHRVFVSDAGKIKAEKKNVFLEKDIAFEEDQHSLNILLDAQTVVKSPGIPYEASIVVQLLAAGIAVIDELEFAQRFSKGKVIAITGTNGKTTTTLLIYHLMKSAGMDVGLAGNVGQSWALQLVEKDYSWWVLEVSSFQIEGFVNLKPTIAILLNITPDHLDRYQYKLEKYAAAKMKLTDKMVEGDHLIFYESDQNILNAMENRIGQPNLIPIALEEQTLTKGYIQNNELHLGLAGTEWSWPTSEMVLHGEHNLINTLAATSAAILAGTAIEEIGPALKSFVNASHRMEEVAEIKGIKFINDSKGTNVDATAFALSAFQEPLIWIAGGVDKGNDYSLLDDKVIDHVKVLICLGKENEKLKIAFSGKIPVILSTEDIREAVQWASDHGTSGDVALLSPACASFDLFKNYEDRGDQFKEAVIRLKDKN
ncbi:UDP-N-acetylmuramoyl-L-alanine--D-glutamate ligase [Cyclobacterium qasimii]|uniref:UDP-N-acetylmuramoylalanine--D-glutamate ligase n=2 Tax=Cyclobacterium qasimii TaxID=1350429 RepID=S7VDW5_9BACT|nr:UDP-N-acetylmuramoyl-L-alanine--D-glutamate ligase [Cyclobacterium qasimii]EPR68445.1 UDP-N-acetylmuramoylalanine--D-glutamate ligase [Cyclobacterium qasimii M12-11B]GEO23771.1 UDP-N-acetylmuramoylalanine--D-glutamate ligase [Cyclobacterium qasimii]